MAVAIKEGLEHEVIDAMIKGEHTLEQMGVVSKKIEPLLREIEGRGGAAKILGGGGVQDSVGFLLCYHPDIPSIESIIKSYGYTFEPVMLGEDGVRLEMRGER
jgi:hypothetical protein